VNCLKKGGLHKDEKKREGDFILKIKYRKGDEE
jgi:hypothetical protein